jgi:hypothetical protein
VGRSKKVEKGRKNIYKEKRLRRRKKKKKKKVSGAVKKK